MDSNSLILASSSLIFSSLPSNLATKASTNSRVLVEDGPRITIDGQSQIHIEVPIEVIASGDTSLRLQLYTPKGELIGLEQRIPLRLAVISPVTTWLTTGMAIILLLAAIVQSVRRVKSRRGK